MKHALPLPSNLPECCCIWSNCLFQSTSIGSPHCSHPGAGQYSELLESPATAHKELHVLLWYLYHQAAVFVVYTRQAVTIHTTQAISDQSLSCCILCLLDIQYKMAGRLCRTTYTRTHARTHIHAHTHNINQLLNSV